MSAAHGSMLTCPDCHSVLNSKFQWEEHLTGSKHLRALALKNSGIDEHQSSAGGRSPSPDMSAAIPGPNNSYRCLYCVDFVCSGIVPMEAHLVGQRHLKNVQRKGLTESNSSQLANNSGLSSPTSSLPRVNSPVEPYPSSSSPTSNVLEKDKSNMIALQADGINYKCLVCDGTLISGPIPLQQHLNGQKHRKNAERHSIRSGCATPPLTATPIRISPAGMADMVSLGRPSSPSIDMSMALIQPDGTYKCAVCSDFFCSGWIPMQDHLVGKNHKKALVRRSISPMPTTAPDVSPSRTPTIRPGSLLTSPQQRVEKAWQHPVKCGYVYDETLSFRPLSGKIQALTPHFAFIGKDEAIPDLLHYLAA